MGSNLHVIRKKLDCDIDDVFENGQRLLRDIEYSYCSLVSVIRDISDVRSVLF